MKKSIALLLLASSVACQQQERAATTATGASEKSAPASAWRLGTAREMQLPQTTAAMVPAIFTASDNTLILGWMEELEKKKLYRFVAARHDGTGWSEPREIRRGGDFFVNWADTPHVAQSGDGTMFAQWLQRSGSGTYDYQVQIARSTDQGKSWSKPVVPHTTEVASEFGFVSMAPEANGVAVTWLDGRDMKHEGEGAMAIRFARLGSDGSLSDEAVLDQRVCECCQTGMTLAQSGPVIVYRDRDTAEVRDSGIVRNEGGSWSAPALVHRDGWVIPGCPVNGPQIDSVGNALATAWFTGAEEKSRVFAAFSTDGGKTFTKPAQISTNESLGRVGIEMLDPDHAVVSWMEKRGEVGLVQLRVISRNGAMTDPITVGQTSSARAAGFPRLARRGNNLLVVWTIPGDAPRIALSEIPLEKVQS